MGFCTEANRKNNYTLLIFAGISVPVALYILSSGGIADVEPALLSGLIAGGIGAGLYYGYSCNFSLIKCAGSGVMSTGCGVLSDIGLGKLLG